MKGRQLAWFWQRFVLQRQTLLADRLPLGMKLHVSARDDVGRRLFKYGVHEQPVFEWLENRPAPARGELAIDVGANLGWYSVLLERLGAGRLDIHAFEPDPENRALLNDNLALNRCEGVTVRPEALADQAGSATLHRYRAINRGKHSLLPLDGMVDSLRVPTCCLDDYLEAAGLEHRTIWLLKIDVEGLEPAVLRGAAKSLARVQSLIMEYSPMYYREGAGNDEAGTSATEWLEALARAGLTPSLWKETAWQPVSIDELSRLEVQCDTVWSRDELGREGDPSDAPAN